jgi:hypothetical protein
MRGKRKVAVPVPPPRNWRDGWIGYHSVDPNGAFVLFQWADGKLVERRYSTLDAAESAAFAARDRAERIESGGLVVKTKIDLIATLVEFSRKNEDRCQLHQAFGYPCACPIPHEPAAD